MQVGLPLAPKRVLTPTNTLLTLPTIRSDALAALASQQQQQQDGGQASQLLHKCGHLQLEAWLASCTGREHARMGQVRLTLTQLFHACSSGTFWLKLCGAGRKCDERDFFTNEAACHSLIRSARVPRLSQQRQ